MKQIRNLILLFLVMPGMSAKAQDVLVKKDGSTIIAKVLEVNPSDIKYKKVSNPNGPTYTIYKKELLAINYENGDKETFEVNIDNSNSNDVSSASSRVVDSKISANNAELISKYNKSVETNKKMQSKKAADNYVLLFGMSENSVLSNENIELSYKKKKENLFPYFQVERISYEINIRNKTDRIIYIDKANCFRMPSHGTTMSYFNNEQVSVGQSSGGGVSVGLGGIASGLGIGGIAGTIAGSVGVGGGSSSSVTSTYSDMRVLSIPPKGEVNIRNEKIVEVSKGSILTNTKTRLIDKAESLDFEMNLSDVITNPGGGASIFVGKDNTMKLSLPSKLTNIGYERLYTESDTPFSLKYFITYSSNPDFSTYSTAHFTIYLREIIGCDKYRKKNIMSGTSRILSNDYITNNDDYIIEGYYPGF